MRALSKPWLAGLLIALGATTFQLGSIGRYGMTVDSPSLLYAGERTLFWMLHPTSPDALDFNVRDPKGFQSHFEGKHSDDSKHYPVLPALIGSVTSHVLHDWLDWEDPIAAHHVGLVLLNGIALLLFCIYACALLGRAPGIAATLALALFPSALAHAPNNPKDWPCAQFYGLAVLAAGVGVLKGRVRHVLAAGALWGVSFACKGNAVFVAPTVALFLPVAWLSLRRDHRSVLTPALAACLLAPLIAFLVFFVTWPWLWQGRPADWWSHLGDYYAHLKSYGFGERQTWTDYPLRALLFMTPPVVLVAALFQLVRGYKLRGEELAAWALLLLWTGLPLLRIARPTSNFYDANRHFLEYIPGLCVMAGAGAVALASGARSLAMRIGRPAWLPRAVVPALIGIGAAGLVWPVAEYHPYEVAYYNSLIGGLGGAQRKALFFMAYPHDFRANGSEGDYWLSSARDELKDLRGLVGKGDEVSTCGCETSHPSAFVLNANDMWGSHFAFDGCHSPNYRTSAFMIASPREFSCWWRELREHESERPVLKRVERGGGLIYEILGRATGETRPPRSPESRYEGIVHPYDKAGARLAAARKVAAGRPIVKREAERLIVYDVIDPATGKATWTQFDPR